MKEVMPSFEVLPTGKPHVSFSEVKLWKECSYRHNLIHIKKIDLSKPSPVLDFGTAVHASCEHYLLTREMKLEIAYEHMEKVWAERQDNPDFSPASLAKAKSEAALILSEVPKFLDDTFPEWEVVDAEHQLYEAVENHPHAFKGFIDGVIKAKGKRGETIYWILDWKTTARGWFREKRSDDMVKAQLALYKNYWCQKHPDIPMKDVRCGFVLLKKAAKPGEHCELFSVSLGEVPIKRSLKVVSNMLTSVKRGIALKNRDACTWCEFKNSEHCT
jgi:hypothetical protein